MVIGIGRECKSERNPLFKAEVEVEEMMVEFSNVTVVTLRLLYLVTHSLPAEIDA